MSSVIKYRKDIDGLRAIAVISVIVFHAFPRLLPGGYVGVDIFFVISGYLISSIIFREILLKKFSFIQFYNKRVRRIFPALSVVLLFCIAFGGVSLFSDEYMQLGKHIAGGAGFLSNIILWREAGYFDVSSELKPLLHLWSLGVEEQFYIFLPPFLLILSHFKAKINFILIALLCFISFFINIFFIKRDPTFSFYFPACRFWELFAGVELAWLTMYSPAIIKYGRIFKNYIAFTGICLIVVAIFFFNEKTSFPGYAAILPVFGCLFVIGTGGDGWINTNILQKKALVWIGLISYPLYLWHWVFLSFARIITPEIANEAQLHIAVNLVCIVLSVIVAAITYYYIEVPVRKNLIFSSSLIAIKWSRAATFFSFLLFVIAIVGYFIFSQEGFHGRYSNLENFLKDEKYFFASVNGKNAEKCRNYFENLRPIGFCAISTLDRQPDVLLIGDSIANQYFPALEQYYSKKHMNIAVLAYNATPAMMNVKREVGPDDIRTLDPYFEYAIKNSNIKTVIIASAAYSTEDGLKYLNEQPTESQANKRDIVSSGLEYTLNRLLRSGKHVVFIKMNPLMTNFNPRSCLNERPFRILPFEEPPLCGVSKYTARKTLEKFLYVTDQVLLRYPEVSVFDPWIYMCDESVCYAKRDGVLLYAHDSKHLSIAGGIWLSRFFQF